MRARSRVLLYESGLASTRTPLPFLAFEKDHKNHAQKIENV